MLDIGFLDSLYHKKNRDYRTALAKKCRDCESIPKTQNAGEIVYENNQELQIMHNGIKVLAGSYGGTYATNIIEFLKGHHEPQEELIFHHLLAACSENSLFIEMGSWWSYYTLWYLKAKPKSRAINIEPEQGRLEIGIKNSEINGLRDRINFVKGWCGVTSDGYKTVPRTGESVLCYDYPRIEKELDGGKVEILHLDIQGGEAEIIDSLSRAKALPRFVVVSTHHQIITNNPNTHRICLKRFENLGARILCEHSIEESYSGDGLIVASFGDKENDPHLPKISRNNTMIHMGPQLFKSYSENLEDVMLWRALKDVYKGFFIDIGSASHDKRSVSKAFYDVQWRGINIEPNSFFTDSYQSQRPNDINIQKAVSDTLGLSTLYCIENTDLSTLDAAIAKEYETLGYHVSTQSTEVTTITKIWNECIPESQEVHFLKIDVGGTEASVIKGNDWKKNRPWIVVVNAYQPISRRETYKSWEDILISSEYVLAYKDGVNHFYVANEKREMLGAFNFPPKCIRQIHQTTQQPVAGD